MKFKIKYIPNNLTFKDKLKQKKMLIQSQKKYKIKKYQTRKKLKSFKSKTSKHIIKAKKIYNIENITPNFKLSKKTGCSIKAFKKIINKGEGAYYSSGSRPNQTAKSWAIARLASSITGGPAAKYDFNILNKHCAHNKTAYKLAKKFK